MAPRTAPVSPGRRLDPGELVEWCRRWLGSPPERTFLRTGNLSTVVGVALADGRRVVVKARAPSRRIAPCTDVQRRLWERGFPCPRPLAGPAPLGALTATAESFVPGGRQLPPSPAVAGRFGEALARMVRLAPPPDELESLQPPPAWLHWDHGLKGAWPRPETTRIDLNALPGPPWLEELARRIRVRLAGFEAPAVVGHADFESQNVRWRAGRLYAVDDWDSVAALPEAVLAGAASAVHPAAGPRAATASIAETGRFLRAYARRRGTPWTVAEREVCWAAGSWVLAYNARVEIAEGGTQLAEQVRRDADLRLTRAGA